MAAKRAGGAAPAGAAVDYTALPLASTAVSVPDYSTLSTIRSAGVTTPWVDAYSGLNVYRMNTDGEGSAALPYANNRYVSLPDSNGDYWIIANKAGNLWLYPFRIGSGRVSTPFDSGLSSNASGDLACCFSSVSASVLYRMNGEIIRKYTWNGSSLTEDTAGVWPKDLSAESSATRLKWLTHDSSDRWFTATCDVGGDERILIWDSQTDTVTNIVIADFGANIPSGYTLDEGYVDHSGRYVMIKLSPLGALLYDTQTGFYSKAFGHASHPSLGRGVSITAGGWSVFDPTAAMTSGNVDEEGRPVLQFAAVSSDAATFPGTVTIVNDGTGASALYAGSDTHTSFNHTQDSAATADQWGIHDIGYGGSLDAIGTWTGAWAVDSGSVYKRVYNVSSRAITSVLQLSSDGATVDSELTLAASRVAMVAGTYFIDAGTRTLYVWRSDSGTVSTTTVTAIPAVACHQGVFAVQVSDPLNVRAVAFGLAHPNQSTYDYSPYGSTSPDGKVCVFTSDLGRLTGPQTICALAMPTGA